MKPLVKTTGLLLSLLLFGSADLHAQQHLKVFILAGQSNMEGQGVVDLDHEKHYNGGKGNLEHVVAMPHNAKRYRHLKTPSGDWRVRDDVWVWFKARSGLKKGGLSIGYTGYGGKHHMGLELQFGHVIGDHLGEQVLLIKTAWGGKSLHEDFRPPSAGGEVGPYYGRMIAEVREVLGNLKSEFPEYDGRGYEIAGFVWMQGWNDMCHPPAIPEYADNLAHLIDDVRKEFGTPTLPVVVGELGNLGPEARGPMAAFRQAQRAGATRARFGGSVAFVETTAFARPKEESPCVGHGHHWFANAESYLLIGEALGKRLVSLLEVRRAQNRLEGKIEAFLGEPDLEIRPLFEKGRFPNLVVTLEGTLVATWGSDHIRACRSEDGGKTWGRKTTIADHGIQGGGTTVDESTGEILAFVESEHPPAPLTVFRSRDDGRTWRAEKVTVHPDGKGNVPSMHMNEHGITLRHGKHKGRLLRPARFYAGKNHASKWPDHYTNAIYSDDGGRTWHTSDPFPAFGAGEAMVAELSDGRIYYNSRRHWAPPGENPRRRWTAWSADGGAHWQGATICDTLPDGPQDTNYGCMAGLVRLPIKDKDILIYSNCDSRKGRNHGTVWASFDGGKTWPLKRLVHEGGFGYSSLTAGRPGTKSEGWIFVHFESRGSKVARLNLSWLLAGVPTGDGNAPKELTDR